MDNVSEDVATEWLDNLGDALATLAHAPGRHAVLSPESRKLGAPIRRILYRRTPSSSMAHYIYYISISEDIVSDLTALEKLPDGPTVLVFSIRNAKRGPFTAADVRQIREEIKQFP